MANYHPVDVRYKGPSTAYTGSANRRKIDKPAFEDARQAAKSPQPLSAKNTANPWDATKPELTIPQTGAHPTRQPKERRKAASTPRMSTPWPVRTAANLLNRLGWFWSIALLYFLATVFF